MELLGVFWSSVLSVLPGSAPASEDRSRLRTREELEELVRGAGLEHLAAELLTVEGAYTGFEDFWRPFAGGVGPSGGFYVKLAPEQQQAVREECRRRLGDPQGPFTLRGSAWAVTGRRPASA
jgi:hypothetical protein